MYNLYEFNDRTCNVIRLLKDKNYDFKVKTKKKNIINYIRIIFENVLYNELSYKRDGKEKGEKVYKEVFTEDILDDNDNVIEVID